MPRVRLGVVIVVPEPVATEIEGLRRALGDPVLDRIMPHVTLVPPVNVRVDDVGAALSVLRAAAATARPMSFTLEPPRTFGPDSPVLYLPVEGDADDLDRLGHLRRALFVAPLRRAVDHDFVPHVTVAAELGPSRLAAGIEALADFTGAFVADSITLLRFDRPPEPARTARWSPIADVRLGAPSIVGRGGFELELTVSSLLDPDAMRLLDDVDADDRIAAEPDRSSAGDVPPGARSLVVTARHRSEVVGVGWGHAWPGDASGFGDVAAVVGAPGPAREGVERQIELALESLIASA